MEARNIMFQAVYTQRNNNFIHIPEEVDALDTFAHDLLAKHPVHLSPVNEICVYMFDISDEDREDTRLMGVCRGLLIDRKVESDDIKYSLKQLGIPQKVYDGLCQTAVRLNVDTFFSITEFVMSDNYSDSGYGNFFITMLPWVLENNTNKHLDMLCLNLNFLSMLLESCKVACYEYNNCYSWQSKYSDTLTTDLIDALNNNLPLETDEDGNYIPPLTVKVFAEVDRVLRAYGADTWHYDMLDLYKECSEFFYDSAQTVWERNFVKALHILKKNDFIVADNARCFFVKQLRGSIQFKKNEIEADARNLEEVGKQFNW